MVINPDASLVIFDDGPVLFTTPEINKTKPTKTLPTEEEEMESLAIIEWGQNNDLPVVLRKAKESNPDLVSALDWKARALYAGGMDYILRDRYTLEEKHSDKKYRKRVYEIDQFLFRNRHYLNQACIDFYDLANVFPEIILSEDRQQITRIAALQGKDCRFAKRANDGYIKKVILNPDWSEWDSSEKNKKLKKVDLIDPLNFDPVSFKEEKGAALKYIYPIAPPTGKNSYQFPFWWSLKQSKWLDFTNMIPAAKDAIIRNMAKIQYHIEMPDYWMSSRYKNWESMTDKAKQDASVKEFKIINDVLHKPENHGKSIYTTFKTQVQTGKEYGGWKITAVDDKMKDGALLADSSEGTIKIFSATSIDPSLHGLIPGKGGSNRSGSDKREALNIYMSLITPHRDNICDPFNVASWYNGWSDEDVETIFFLRIPHLQTLNQVSPALRETQIPEPDAD
ncbi:hypothetical protein [Belliella pelovolcani]|uniref:hypothetical protein n=1 Tax=Belliella pelovolcani TaxID=529505 RepID=UPI00391B56DC